MGLRFQARWAGESLSTDTPVLDQLLLIRGEQELVPPFHVRALLAFLNPFGVRLEEGKHLLVGGNGFFVQQPLPHLVHLFETPSVLCSSSIPRSGRPLRCLRTPLARAACSHFVF